MGSHFVLSNPGGGAIDGTCTLEDALVNMDAFARDLVEVSALALPPPAVLVTHCDDDDDPYSADYGGRMRFWLQRGDRECEVRMPGRPLCEVRDQDGALPQIPPRLYVDGDSYYWHLATSVVADRLFDWDGQIARDSKLAEARAHEEIATRPGCPTCGALRDVRDISYATYLPPQISAHYAETRSTYQRHPYVYEVRCWICQPHIDTRKGEWGGTLTITRRPRGAAEGAMCRKFVNCIPTSGFNRWANYCRLPNRHADACEGDYHFTLTRSS